MKRFGLRLLTALLAAALLTLPGPQSQAEEENLIIAGQVLAVPGETVLYPITMESAAQIAACKLFVTADTGVFSVPSNSDGVSSRVQKGAVTKNGTLIAAPYSSAGWQINWYNVASNVTAKGVFCCLPVTVAADTPLGTYEVGLSCSANNTCTLTGQNVPFRCVGGSIRVVSSAPTVYTDPVTACAGEGVVELPICLRNNPGLTALSLSLTDTAALEVLVDRDGDPMASPAEGLSDLTLIANKTGGTTELLWFGPVASDDNGLIATVRCRVRAEAGASVTVPLTLGSQKAVGDSYQEVFFTFDLASVTAAALRIEEVLAAYSAASGGYDCRITLSLPCEDIQYGIQPVLAAYDSGGRYLGCSFDITDTGEDTVSMTLPLKEGSAAKLKVFILAPESLAPLAPAVEKTLGGTT